jgi:phosphoglucosamine mutase
MNTFFGTDGIRGRTFEPPLDELTVRRLGAALAADLAVDAPAPRILLAGDTRASTDTLAEWIASSIRAAGGEVVWGGVLPTPAVSHLLRDLGGFAAGVVISASHNPAHDNGIKILGPGGEKLADDRERHLEQRLPLSEPLLGPGLPPSDTALAGRYLDLLAATHPSSSTLAGLHVVIDAANGAASGIAGALMRRLGARVTAIASEPDGFNINLNCGATSPGQLAEAVTVLGADAGIALDGDADRAVLVDELGHILDGDDILLVWADQLHAAGRLPGDRVVATVMSNFGLERALAARGLDIIRCPVGDRSVWLAMQEHGAALGGEQSGHVICSHYGVSGDGLLTGSHLLAVAVERRVPVSQLSDLQRLPQVLLNVPICRKLPFEGLPRIADELAHTHLRLARRGRVLLRYSGTEPMARVMIEGEDAAEIEALAEGLANAIRRELG